MSCGYTVTLSGWTHTRAYAKGFLRNISGDGKAVVEGLVPGVTYKYGIYQYSTSNFAGTNPYSVNGRNKGDTTSKPSDAMTASGTAVADSRHSATYPLSHSLTHSLTQ